MRYPEKLRRRGSVLVYVALMLFALMGVAALVIDLGFVRFTREEMQVRADEAALEALRGNDPDALLALDAANQAGPRRHIEYSGGIARTDTQYLASQLLSIADDPDRYMVTPNDPETPDSGGDVLSGNVIEGPDTFHVENHDYSRDDYALLSTADAVLVRLRRTNEAASATRSVRPPLPTIFARGTTADPNAKAAGVSLRATAVAATRIHEVDADGTPVLDMSGNPVTKEVGRAKSVGMPITTPVTLLGLTPFGLKQTFWDSLTVNAASAPMTVDSGSGIISVSGSEVGTYTAGGNSLGALIVPQAPAGGVASVEGYVPVYLSLPGSDGAAATRRIIGFGHARLDTGSSGTTVTKLAGGVVPRNASVTVLPQHGTSPFAGLDATGVAAVMNAHTTFTEPITVPVLVRATGPVTKHSP